MQLSDFTLLDELGAGAMGTVWRARHTRHGFEAAIKFANLMNEGRSRDALAREIEAVASLNHPGIVDIFDVGETPADVAAQVESLAPGIPWFAMELAPSGSLAGAEWSSWPRVRHVALQMLDGLAHAHARGVIHRDLKPGNVLVVRDSFHGPLVLLTDFGIAHVLVDRGVDMLDAAKATVNNQKVASAGTPLYMAPEQYRSQWRDFGPWTDIYALGCMIYEWVAGEAPFQANSLMRLAYRHCNEEIPPLGPAPVGYPAGLDDWLRRACAKHPKNRFASAADAAHALLALGEPEKATFAAPGVDSEAKTSFPTEWASTTLPLVDFQLSVASEASEGEPEDLEVFAQPPIPAAYKRPETASLGAAGLGLFGLRSIPFVDRDRPRQMLWDALRTVRSTGRPRGVVLTGDAGSGKSRLVRWISQRANESAGIESFSAFHGPGANHRALIDMVLDFVRGYDLDREELSERLDTRLPELSEQGREVVLDYLSDPTKRMAMPPPARHLMFRELLKARADTRPVVLWLDDVVWGHEALGLAEHLLQTMPKVPVLVVMTIRSKALEDAPQVESRISRMRNLDSVDFASLQPLSRPDHEELVHRMLGLEQSLVQQVIERTEGNPLFAVQLVGDLVQRGELEPGIEGIRLRDEATELPTTMMELWSRRLAELLGAFETDRDLLQMLMVAAALGDRVNDAGWESILHETGLGDPHGLVDAMVRRRLATRLENGWRFSHGLFREAIEASGRTDGRWIAANAACARWLAAFEDLDHWDEARLGRFWREADDTELAFEHLFAASWGALHSEEFSVTLRLLDEVLELADELGLAPEDERRGHIEIRRYLAERFSRPLEETVRLVQDLIVRASNHGWPAVEAEARMLAGTRLSGMSRFDEALQHQQAALQLLEEVGDEGRILHAMGVIAYTMWFTEQREEALALQHEVATRREAYGDVSGMASDFDKLGFMYLDRDPRRALHYYRRGVELADQLGRRELQGHITDGMGRVSYLLGNYDEAIESFREAARLFDMVGAPAASMSRYHEAHARMMLYQEWAGALVILGRVIPLFEAYGVRMYVASASAGKALAHAQLGEFAAAAEAFRKSAEFWSETPKLVRRGPHADFVNGLLEFDAPGLAELVGEFVERHGVE